jgi:hypothetical protein
MAETDWEERGGGDRSSDLDQGLRGTRETRVASDGDADRNGPERAEQQRGVYAEKSEGGTAKELVVVGAMKIGKFANTVENSEAQSYYENHAENR